MNAQVYVDIDQGIHKGKLKVARNEKRKKLSGFSFSINIANFEAFCPTKKLISSLFFLKSAMLIIWVFQDVCPRPLSKTFVQEFVQDVCPRHFSKTFVQDFFSRCLQQNLKQDSFQRHPGWVKSLNKHLEQTSRTNVLNKRLEQTSWTNVLNKHLEQTSWNKSITFM